ncbi:MAG: prefoldin subunit beta [Nanoarchaeota archaeon]|nr:prefoldin subunit beta [Nanoarchaeota archaeon]
MSGISNGNKEKIEELQLLEQNISALIAQKQQFQTQVLEMDSALSELKNTKKAYKIIGNIMVLSEKEELKQELTNKKEMLELRIKAIDKQENNIKTKATDLQHEVLKNMKG